MMTMLTLEWVIAFNLISPNKTSNECWNYFIQEYNLVQENYILSMKVQLR